MVLDAAAMPARRRIFMTATPVSSPAGTSLLSMSDVALFGPVVHRLDFADAVAAEVLCDYEVLVFEAAGQAAPDPVAALVAGTAGLHSVLTFHGRVAKARAFASAVDGVLLPDGRRVVAAAVAGTDPDGQRQQALRLLANPQPDQLVVVSSARCLAEGVDIPAVDGVMFVDPKQSTVDVVQAVGRAIRRSPGKARGLVLLPVCIPADVDDDTVLSTSAFANVWRVLRGLRALDTRLAVELTTIARSPACGRSDWPHRDTRGSSRVRFALPSLTDLSRLVARTVDATSPAWDLNLAELEAYAYEHRAARPPRGTALGEWCERQRIAHRRGLLPPDRAAQLRGLSGWVWDLAEQRWLDQCAQVAAGAYRAGRLQLGDSWAMGQHLNVRDRGAQVKTVSQWCAAQRQQQRRGDLGEQRRNRLDEIPGWNWHPLPPAEETCLDLLAEYVAWKGDANPPAGYVEDDQPVGRWLNQVRRRRVTGQLEQPLVDELHVAGAGAGPQGQLRWFRTELLWMLGVEALNQFTIREGHVKVRDGHLEELPDFTVPLSDWCRRQRHAHRYGDLSDQRAALLERVPGWRWEIEPGPRVLMDIGDARHGSRTGYVKGCRCTPCNDANTADHSQRAAREAAGLPGTDWVSAAAARGHLRVLVGQGAGIKPLARACGLNVKTVNGLIDGSTNRIHPGTEQAVLATGMAEVRLTAAPGTRIATGPTWALLDEILSRGWPTTTAAHPALQPAQLQPPLSLAVTVHQPNPRKRCATAARSYRRAAPTRSARTSTVCGVD